MLRGFSGAFNRTRRSVAYGFDLSELPADENELSLAARLSLRRGNFVNTFESVRNVTNLVEFFRIGARTRRGVNRGGVTSTWGEWRRNLNTMEKQALRSGRMFMKVALTLSLQGDYAVGDNLDGESFVVNDTNFFKKVL